jgi:hypothetical protein
MKNFDTRWKNIVDRARDVEPCDEQAPFGFAARVVAGSVQARTRFDFTWDRLIARFLTGAIAALFLCAAIEWRHLRDERPLEPGIENSVAQLVWTL